MVDRRYYKVDESLSKCINMFNDSIFLKIIDNILF